MKKEIERPAITVQAKSKHIRNECENSDRLAKAPSIDDYDRIYGQAEHQSRNLFSTKGYKD